MLKSISCLVLALSMGAYAEIKPQLLEEEYEEAEVADEGDDPAWLQPDVEEWQAEIQEAQWHGGRRGWTCWVRSRQGRTFSGSSRSRDEARRIAMRRCGSVSSSCRLSSCR